jgi:hypothetical protein
VFPRNGKLEMYLLSWIQRKKIDQIQLLSISIKRVNQNQDATDIFEGSMTLENTYREALDVKVYVLLYMIVII